MPERAIRPKEPESEKSAEVVVARGCPGEGPNGGESESITGLAGKGPLMSRQLELPFESRGEAPRVERSEEEPSVAVETSVQARGLPA